jgi:hypothetical protein
MGVVLLARIRRPLGAQAVKTGLTYGTETHSLTTETFNTTPLAVLGGWASTEFMYTSLTNTSSLANVGNQDAPASREATPNTS